MSSTSQAAPPASPVAGADRKRAGSGERGFRPDIQGLRAVAVSLVVVYHLYPSRLPGGFAGVDVFFVISGFLITSHLWRTASKSGRLSLVDFWGRRARRLVPAAALVLAVTWVGSYLLLPSSRLADTAQQIGASALYFQNWLLSGDAVNYLKSNDAPSPVQHFWSLSVEEQFYLVWPLLFLVGLLVARRWRPDGRHRASRGPQAAPAAGAASAEGTASRPGGAAPQGGAFLAGTAPGPGTAPIPDPGAASAPAPAAAPGPAHDKVLHRTVFALTAALVVASLAYSVYDTRTDAAAAYFVTTTRMWELGLGGLLALLPATLSRAIGRHGWLGWAGLALIAASQFVLNAGTPFPGWIAILPVGGAVLLIAGGSAEGRGGPWRLTSLRPAVFIGDISYSLYLWHYPVIVLYTAWRGKEAGLATGPALIVVSVLLAWLTKVTLEDRVRLAPFIARHKWRSVGTALAAVVPVTLVAVFLATQPGPWDGKLGPGYPGAAALADHLTSLPAKPVLPSPAVTVPVPDYWTDGCLDGEHTAATKVCAFGDRKDPALTVVLVGDSIAGNWWAPLNAIANQEHWELITELHATCPWTTAALYDPTAKGSYPACSQWGRNVLSDLLTKVHPDVVIATGSAGNTTMANPKPGPAARAEVGAGEAAYWSQLESHGIPVIALSETPDTGLDGPACVTKYGPYAKPCDIARSVATFTDPPTSYAARALHGQVPVIDLNSLICSPSACPAVVGNVLVYFDSHHLTQSYSQTLTPYLKAKIVPAVAAVRAAPRK